MFEILQSAFLAALFDVQLAIPSPPRNSIQIGPLTVHAYGLMIGLGMIAGVSVATRRWTARGGSPDAVVQVATWGVPAGIIGARLYHVITDWKTYADTGWINTLKITNGGLGIPGGLLLGILFGYIAMRRLNIDTPRFIDAALPGIPIAQAIGRLGNWFNQELFGKPTTVPWAVEIDSIYRERASIPQEYLASETFHPTFAYEAVWNLMLAGLLVFVTNRKYLKPGQSIFLWIAGYGVGRFLVESLRIDPASLVWGVRVNHWVSGLAVLVGLAGLIWAQRSASSSKESGSDEPVTASQTKEDDDTSDVESSEDEQEDDTSKEEDIDLDDDSTEDELKVDAEQSDKESDELDDAFTVVGDED